MTDYFADLERQLVTATADRSRRVRRARARRGAALATVLLAVLAGGAGLATALSSGDDGGVPASPTPTTAPAGTPPTGHRDAFIVSVLNGTSAPGLARGVANRLQNARFKIGNVTNAADQTHTTTLVEYARGHRAEAATVALAIDAPQAGLRPIDAGSRAIAGDQATVIVIVGADQDTSPRR